MKQIVGGSIGSISLNTGGGECGRIRAMTTPADSEPVTSSAYINTRGVHGWCVSCARKMENKENEPHKAIDNVTDIQFITNDGVAL